MNGIWIKVGNYMHLTDCIKPRFYSENRVINGEMMECDFVNIQIGQIGNEELYSITTLPQDKAEIVIGEIWQAIKKGEPYEIPIEYMY